MSLPPLARVTHLSLAPLATPSYPSPSGRGQVYIARMKYDTIGPRRDHVLSFEKGEEFEVLNASGSSEWWEVSHELCMSCSALPCT